MARDSASASYLWPNWLTLLLGAWLFISPWVLAAPALGAWAWNAWIVGILVAMLSVIALFQIAQWEDWGNLILGAWLFVSPWFLGYAGDNIAAWNAYVVGALVAAIAIWGIVAARSSGSVHA